MPLERPATPFPEIEYDRGNHYFQTNQSSTAQIRNYLDNSGVLVLEGVRPQYHHQLRIPGLTRRIAHPLTHHYEPHAPVGHLSSPNGKDSKRLSLILNGDPIEALGPSRHSSASASTLASTPTSTASSPSSASSTSSPIGVGMFKHEQIKHLNSLEKDDGHQGHHLWNGGPGAVFASRRSGLVMARSEITSCLPVVVVFVAAAFALTYFVVLGYSKAAALILFVLSPNELENPASLTCDVGSTLYPPWTHFYAMSQFRKP
ncbi:hypothetical protein CROQUDRAFT_131264 [Cronartium quercuum f. sp. fusiforme G11]|uniref:Uncharacterized protein n=1 Tax=Cronartium quercuum f. sp. fusiforme G11 TaxID=708437 RepID=A0A9P6NLX6_9BASI|nr:hypothetical protein CROQUDRAFT_131264 [Cronartium quercuum f. sp. fusiforme G11]